MNSYKATIEAITDTELRAVYRQQGMPTVGIGIPIPVNRDPSKSEVIKLMQKNAVYAIERWAQVRREAVCAGRAVRLQEKLQGLTISENFDTEQSGVIEL